MRGVQGAEFFPEPLAFFCKMEFSQTDDSLRRGCLGVLESAEELDTNSLFARGKAWVGKDCDRSNRFHGHRFRQVAEVPAGDLGTFPLSGCFLPRGGGMVAGFELGFEFLQVPACS